MQILCCNDVECSAFDAPSTWDTLKALNLNENILKQLPSNLGLLSNLKVLELDKQKGDFQVTQPMTFITELRHLRKLSLRRADGTSVWSSISMFFLMQAQMLIEDTPGCKVTIVD